MKKIFTTISASLGLIALTTVNALAAGGGFWNNPQTGAPPTSVSQDTIGGSITNLINYFIGILGLISVAFLIYAGVLMVTAGGDEEQVGKSKKIITFAVIGLVIIMLSWGIVSFITQALG